MAGDRQTHVPDGTGTEPIGPRRSDCYYGSGYWNEIAFVRAEINRRVTGRSDQEWFSYFHDDVTSGRRFGRALFLNCGDGHIERQFLEHGIIDSGVGIDISENLLATAREASKGLPLRYVCMDTNSGVLPDDRYDLVVNNAAGHHIANLDRVLRACCRALTPDGYFVNYDYVGAHRNQYPWPQWEACWKLNSALPEEGRQQLAYPHLPTGIAIDPSEAVHSELLLEIFLRYFTVEHFRPTGGALAYPLLTFNEALKSLQPEGSEPIVRKIMEADARYLAEHPHSTLFAFWCGRPKHDVLLDVEMLARWEADENDREARSIAAGGRYYPRSLIEALMYAPEGTGAKRQ